MSDKSKIEWCDASWNPVTGCTKVSEGCRNCYASTFSERFRGTPGHYFENGFDLTLRPDKLDQPYSWKRPRKIFVNSMSDLFHKDIPDDFIWSVFHIMAKCPQHTFQVLTKRPERMMQMLKNRYWRNLDPIHALIIEGEHRETDSPFLPNVWLGTSVENQQVADERIPHLLGTPAAVRFLSMEPLLGPVNLNGFFYTADLLTVVSTAERRGISNNDAFDYVVDNYPDDVHKREDRPSWIIVGGESGSKARPMHPEWARSIRDQCKAAGLPFFFKQYGEWAPFNSLDYMPKQSTIAVRMGIETIWRVGKHKAGRLLDGDRKSVV